MRTGVDPGLYRDMWLGGVPLQDIADKLCYSRQGVQAAARRAGLPWRQQDGCIWSLQTLLDALHYHGPDVAAAKAIGLHLKSFRAAVSYYGITDADVAAHQPVAAIEDLPFKEVAPAPAAPRRKVTWDPKGVASRVAEAKGAEDVRRSDGRWPAHLDARIYDTGGRYAALVALADAEGLRIGVVTARWHIVRAAGRPQILEAAE